MRWAPRKVMSGVLEFPVPLLWVLVAFLSSSCSLRYQDPVLSQLIHQFSPPIDQQLSSAVRLQQAVAGSNSHFSDPHFCPLWRKASSSTVNPTSLRLQPAAMRFHNRSRNGKSGILRSIRRFPLQGFLSRLNRPSSKVRLVVVVVVRKWVSLYIAKSLVIAHEHNYLP